MSDNRYVHTLNFLEPFLRQRVMINWNDQTKVEIIQDNLIISQNHIKIIEYKLEDIIEFFS
jgi:hypothetical protein